MELTLCLPSEALAQESLPAGRCASVVDANNFVLCLMIRLPFDFGGNLDPGRLWIDTIGGR
jgi:hypothetical protein